MHKYTDGIGMLVTPRHVPHAAEYGKEVKSIKFLFRLIDDNHSYHRALENPFLLHAGNAICRSGKAFKQLVFQLNKTCHEKRSKITTCQNAWNAPTESERGARIRTNTHTTATPQTPHHIMVAGCQHVWIDVEEQVHRRSTPKSFSCQKRKGLIVDQGSDLRFHQELFAAWYTREREEEGG